jgi:imidazolonepropionase-like amidohydrolase
VFLLMSNNAARLERIGFYVERFMRMLAAAVLAASSFFYPQSPQRDVVLAFRNVDVFDGSRMIRRTRVVVSGGMIRGVGPDIAIPPSAQIIEGEGKTLLPGFFDSHTHLGQTFGEQFLKDALVFGVTTELEMWGSPPSLAFRAKVAAGDTDMADLRSAGIGVTVPRGHPTQMGGPSMPTLSPGDDVQAFVDARIAEGADYIKIVYEPAFPTLSKQQIKDVVAAAHRRNKLAVIHITRQSDARDAIEAGVDGLVHIFADSLPEPGFAEFAARHHVFVIATLATIESVTSASPKPWWQDVPHVASHITPSMRRSLEMKYPPGFGEKLKLSNALSAIGALRRAGVTILAGTDAPAPGTAHGVSIHRELELLVRSGLTPTDALVSATFAPSRAFGFYDRGRIAEGLRADLLLVNGDPTVDITATRNIVGVWKSGVRHQPTTTGN